MIEQLKWCNEHEHDFYKCGTGDAVCENCGLTKYEANELTNLLNEYDELLGALKTAKPWVAKCSADHDSDNLGLRAHKALEHIEEAIHKAKKKR